MDKLTASKITQQLKEIDRPLNIITALADEITDEEERKQYLRAIAEVVSDVYIKLIRPITRKFPELESDVD